ncbi:phytanoyl-CoA dioxygenase family protein [Synoicihabitans lomoniglobus]|uniref:Phytanoyl-CoA dioxygenase family protein n=1 Tax=Synoicihabitans lomoniglobus TaxID=2909285 RepID=A0AAE9ZXK3_9BACT|nr:phytanoyl-CoA dioxygenase family protein [Opitutaceae bacterium LMO-M01]WED65381.1 phytanoyl-CoA dioxygenase family protein [Opitutaceae bacterium LMO-M01]
MSNSTAAPAPVSTLRANGYFGPDFDPAELRRFYDEHGYFVIEDALTPAEVTELRDDATAICRGQRGELKGAQSFPADATDDEVLRNYLCIHFPGKISPVMHANVHHEVAVRALVAALGPNVKCMQTMLFIKSAGKPGQAWHQDEDYIPTRDRSLIGAWISIDHATVENGGLWIIPGSHRHGILWDQHWHDDRRFDCSEESVGFPYTDDDAVPVEVKPGSIVFFNGYTLHRSLPNRAAPGTYRRALVNHYMRAESFLPWMLPTAGEAGPLAKLDFRDVEMVAGVDPYAHRGYEKITQPMLRPDGRSGCISWSQSGNVNEYSAAPVDHAAEAHVD